MTYLFGALLLCLLSVRALNQSHKIYTEMTGAVTKVISILYTVVGLGAAIFAYRAVNEFIKYMGG